MRILKQNVLLRFINSYIVDVRCTVLFLICYNSSYNCHYIVTSIKLGNSERELLNIASLFKIRICTKLLVYNIEREVFIMVKARLPEDKFQMFLNVGSSLYSYGGSWTLFNTNLLLKRMTVSAYSVISISNGMSYQPKMKYKLQRVTAGMPKGNNFYGIGATIVSARFTNLFTEFNVNWGKSVAVNNLLKVRRYCTDVQHKVLTRLDNLTKYCSENPERLVDRKIYSILCDPHFLQFAYNNNKIKGGKLSYGVSTDTLDGIDWSFFLNLSDKLTEEKFQFKAGRGIQIDKARPLTIASARDKIVQAGLKIILNSIFEPTFLEYSHGFRPNKSCHTAFQYIQQQFKAVSWIIEGDISNCFDSIDHTILMKIIENKILDRQFTKLIWKSIRAGYFEFHYRNSELAWTPQGSLVSPILSNIFMHQLDVFIQSLIKDFYQGRKPSRKVSQKYSPNVYKMNKSNKNEEWRLNNKYELLRRTVSSVDFYEPDYRILRYVRYADYWIIGIKGSLQDTKLILDKVTAYCKSIGVTISPTKTKIINLKNDKFKFLGVYFSRSINSGLRQTTGKTSSLCLRLRSQVSISDIKRKLREGSFLKGDISNPKFLWYHLDHRQILTLYNSVLREIINYFGFVHNYGKFSGYVYFTLKFSCAKLLAAKFKIRSLKKVFTKFGSDLTFVHPVTNKKYSFFKPTKKVNTNRFQLNVQPEIKYSICQKHISIKTKPK